MINSFFFGGGFGIIFIVMFILIVGMILFALIKGIAQWNKNNHSPKLTVSAMVVAKRTQVSHHTHHNAGNVAHMHHTSFTHYYVTFEVESGDRMELNVDDGEYGYLAEGDRGRLTFQGTRYLGFERQ